MDFDGFEGSLQINSIKYFNDKYLVKNVDTLYSTWDLEQLISNSCNERTLVHEFEQ